MSDTNIFVTTEQVEEIDKFYWCTYGVTTYQQISDALNAGKTPVCHYHTTSDDSDASENQFYFYSINNSDKHYFSSIYGNLLCSISVSSSNQWTEDSRRIQLRDYLTDDITSYSTSSLYYPSTKGVVDYVAEHGGGSSNLYVCTYGTTTYQEISDAITAGKIPICAYGTTNYPNQVYTYVGIVSEQHYFTSCFNDKAYSVSVDTTGTWTQGDTTLEVLRNKSTTIDTTSDVKYPTTKAVADYWTTNNKFFWCTYGTTTYQEISDALSDGKVPVCIYHASSDDSNAMENQFFVYSGLLGNYHFFGNIMSNLSFTLSVDTSNNWSTGGLGLEQSSFKSSTITGYETSTAYYPNTKAVSDYTTAQIATETARATTAEGTLTTNLEAEVTRATNAEATKENVTNKTDNVGEGSTTNYPSTKAIVDYWTDQNKFYWCTYGVTTYAEITNAITAGKTPVCIYSTTVVDENGEENYLPNQFYIYSGLLEGEYSFASLLANLICNLYVNSSSSWRSYYKPAEVTNYKTNDITSYSTSSSYYPSTKGVADYVTTQVGTETTRATNAENTLTTNLETETTRATNAEVNLNSIKENVANKVTSISSTSTDSEYPTAKCVYNTVASMATGMIYQGTLAHSATIEATVHELPTAELAHSGWTYKVIETYEYIEGEEAEQGDMYICSIDTTTAAYRWKIIPAFEKVRDVMVDGVSVVDSSGFARIPDKFYFCTVGTTTYQQITDALTAGKTPICKYTTPSYTNTANAYENQFYVYAGLIGGSHYFATIMNDTSYMLQVSTSNVWTPATKSLQAVNSRVSTITGYETSTTYYPSTKAVADYVTTNIAIETSRAQTAETDLQTNITNEATTRSTADTNLQTDITYEVSRATAAEEVLTTNLDNEVTRATTAEGTLTTTLDAEIQRATNSESNIQGLIEDEETRATEAENGLGTDLQSEITRATNAEATKENVANKKTTITGNESSDTYYPSTKAVADYVSSIKELYWCTYNTTTGPDIETALTNNLLPAVKYAPTATATDGVYIFALKEVNSNITNYVFITNRTASAYTITAAYDATAQTTIWTPATTELQSSNYKRDTIVGNETSSVLYPSTKAVADYVTSNKEFYKCTVSTTGPEVQAAIDAGKLPIYDRPHTTESGISHYLYRYAFKYVFTSGTIRYYFTANAGDTCTTAYCNYVPESEITSWSFSDFYVENRGNKVQTIGEGSTTYYPSTKAVADFVETETTRAETAEGTLQTNIDSETTRAETAEGTLQTNITTEVNRATAAEALKEDTANKKTTITGNESSTTYYPSTKAVVDYWTAQNKFFFCTYNTTTYAEITNAITAGKTPVCIYQTEAEANAYENEFFIYSGLSDEGSHTFGAIYGFMLRTMTVTADNAWSVAGGTLERTSRKANDIETYKTSTSNYPSTKAVADYSEALSNKTTTLTSSSTDTQYPSAKSVVDYVAEALTDYVGVRQPLENGVDMTTLDSGVYVTTSSRVPSQGLPDGFSKEGKLVIFRDTSAKFEYNLALYSDIYGKLAIWNGTDSLWVIYPQRNNVQYSWRDYTTITDAVTANITKFQDNGVYLFEAILSSGQYRSVILDRASATALTLTDNPAGQTTRYYSTDGGATWTQTYADASHFVWCTYGETSGPDIKALIDSGNIPVVSTGGAPLYIYSWTVTSGTKTWYYFGNSAYNSMKYAYAVYDTSTDATSWYYNSATLEITNHRVSTLVGYETNTSTYPSSAAVVNYLHGHIIGTNLITEASNEIVTPISTSGYQTLYHYRVVLTVDYETPVGTSTVSPGICLRNYASEEDSQSNGTYWVHFESGNHSVYIAEFRRYTTSSTSVMYIEGEGTAVTATAPTTVNKVFNCNEATISNIYPVKSVYAYTSGSTFIATTKLVVYGY